MSITQRPSEGQEKPTPGKVIHRISSDLPTFKTLDFKPGLNLLVAEKSPGATDRQTRNGAGKTSLIESIHFLLGGDCDKNSIFKSDSLAGHSFSMEMSIAGVEVKITRSGSTSGKILLEGDINQWPPGGGYTLTGDTRLSNKEWSALLRSLIFPQPPAAMEIENSPTFRELFPYFARRQDVGGFLDPEKFFKNQSTGKWQVALTFLLGLDWSIPAEWHTIRDRERTLKELRKAVGKGVLGREIGSAASLRTQLTVAEEATRRLKEQLAGFRVHEEYNQLEEEASRLTRELADLADQNTLDRQYLGELEEATAEEKPPELPNLEKLYTETGVVLPDTAMRRFEDVEKFHLSVVRNRKAYLSREIDLVSARIRDRDKKKSRIDKRRSEVMEVLSSHGALDQFRELQSELNRREAETESIRQRFDAALALETKKTELKIERARLYERLRQDHQEQGETLREAILVFEEISSSLYEKAGSLTIAETENGPTFEIQIHGKRSGGISHMQIFCFDMMLTRLCLNRGIGPGFLVHDSHLFDGVDERQVAKALQIGASLAEKSDFQYIVTMNTDSLPKDLPPDFSPEDHILPVHLDDTENGGLFGIPF